MELGLWTTLPIPSLTYYRRSNSACFNNLSLFKIVTIFFEDYLDVHPETTTTSKIR